MYPLSLSICCGSKPLLNAAPLFEHPTTDSVAAATFARIPDGRAAARAANGGVCKQPVQVGIAVAGHDRAKWGVDYACTPWCRNTASASAAAASLLLVALSAVCEAIARFIAVTGLACYRSNVFCRALVQVLGLVWRIDRTALVSVLGHARPDTHLSTLCLGAAHSRVP